MYFSIVIIFYKLKSISKASHPISKHRGPKEYYIKDITTHRGILTGLMCKLLKATLGFVHSWLYRFAV